MMGAHCADQVHASERSNHAHAWKSSICVYSAADLIIVYLLVHRSDYLFPNILQLDYYYYVHNRSRVRGGSRILEKGGPVDHVAVV